MEQLGIVLFPITLNLSSTCLTQLVSNSLDVHPRYKTAECQYLQSIKTTLCVYVECSLSTLEHISRETGNAQLQPFWK